MPAKKRKNGKKIAPFTAFQEEIEAAYRSRRYQSANSIFDKYQREMTEAKRTEAVQMTRFVRDFDPDPMYGRMSRPETQGLFAAYRDLKRTGSGQVHVLVEYLEADLDFFASGYIREAILQLLKQKAVDFGPDLDERLRLLILATVLETPKRHSRNYWRLAPRVSNAKFVDEIGWLTCHPLAYVRANARAVVQVFRSAKLQG